MVIQSNMSPRAIVQVWENTEVVFEKNHIALSDQTLETLVATHVLAGILVELNAAVGSSSTTCVEGG